MFAAAALSMLVSTTAYDCRIDVSGTRFDLSGLRASADYTIEDPVEFTYNLNFCGVSVEPDCARANGTLCQLSRFAEEINVLARDTQPVATLIDPTDPSQGLNLKFKDGDACFPTMEPRDVEMVVMCSDATDVTITIAEPMSCHYKVVVDAGRAGCPAADKCNGWDTVGSCQGQVQEQVPCVWCNATSVPSGCFDSDSADQLPSEIFTCIPPTCRTFMNQDVCNSVELFKKCHWCHRLDGQSKDTDAMDPFCASTRDAAELPTNLYKCDGL